MYYQSGRKDCLLLSTQRSRIHLTDGSYRHLNNPPFCMLLGSAGRWCDQEISSRPWSGCDLRLIMEGIFTVDLIAGIMGRRSNYPGKPGPADPGGS